MSEAKRRSFSLEFKLAVIARLEAGESGSALALEVGVKRTIIYRWRDAWRAGGAPALRSKPGRPAKLRNTGTGTPVPKGEGFTFSQQILRLQQSDHQMSSKIRCFRDHQQLHSTSENSRDRQSPIQSFWLKLDPQQSNHA